MSRTDETPDNARSRKLILAADYDARLIGVGGLDRTVAMRPRVVELRAFNRKRAQSSSRPLFLLHFQPFTPPDPLHERLPPFNHYCSRVVVSTALSSFRERATWILVGPTGPDLGWSHVPAPTQCMEDWDLGGAGGRKDEAEVGLGPDVGGAVGEL